MSVEMCQTYYQSQDMRFLGPDYPSGECPRKATRLVTLDSGTEMKLCGHRARSWKNGACSIELLAATGGVDVRCISSKRKKAG